MGPGMNGTEAGAQRVLVFAPVGRDGTAISEYLQRGGLEVKICGTLAELVRQLEIEAAVAFVAEEGLFGADTASLFAWTAAQPAWSDLPFIVLTSRQELPAVTAWRHQLVTALRTAALLERPIHPMTLSSAVQTALRARRRQYEIRELLEARDRAAADLEVQIQARTRDLEDANRELRKQMEERARVEESLRQAQKIEAIGQLTGGIAHDFNNLLMVISGGLEMLDRQTDPERRSRLMAGMQQAAQRGTGLTKQLLAFSRRQDLKPEPVDLKRQIGGMQELLDRTLSGDVQVDFELAEDLWPVEVDPGELGLVVLNLAVNARDAMPNGGTIIVRAENLPAAENANKADLVRLSMSDTGTGMSPETQARVFEPFYTTKDIGKGSGLGLAQVHGFVKQSGGSIEINSAVGEGTTITLLLPRSSKAPGPDEERPPNPNCAQRGLRATGSILLVEDDDQVAALVGEMLDHLGYDIVRVASATGALDVLADGRSVDVLFSDVMMPGGMNGVELAREARARRADLPILLTSGYADAARSAAEEQDVNILPKPYGINELSAALREARASNVQAKSMV